MYSTLDQLPLRHDLTDVPSPPVAAFTAVPARGIRYGVMAAFLLTVIGLIVLVGPPRAAGAPVETVLPIPVAGLATGPTGLAGPLVAQHVTAATDTAEPGVTHFRGTEGTCACMIHWRNLATGAAGTSNLWFGLPAADERAVTGSGVLIAAVTTSGAGGPITALPGAGLWLVP
ncbi:hypothetical protein [Rhodococcus qingshengii]